MRFIMESEILKFILSNQGSVDTEDLVYNLCDYSLLTEIICKNDKFVSCLFADKKPRVVVQSPVTVCRVKDCPSSCGRLHLCLAFLFSESCPFRNRCHFSHDLQSDYNMEVLREFGLEALSRTELCLLLLQSNNTLLPPICYKYNSQGGCQDECPRLHICERYLCRDCNCPRTHDFSAPQPLKLLRDKRIPDHLIKVFKSVYANKRALRQAAASNSDNNEYEAGDSSQDAQNAGYDSDSSSCSRQSGRGKSGRRGRGGRGHTGAYRGYRPHGRTQHQETEETLLDDNDSDSSSVSAGHSKDMRGGYGPERGGFRGNRRGRGNWRGGRGCRGNRGASKFQKTPSDSDIQAADNLDDIEAETSQNPPASNIFAADWGNNQQQRRQRDKTEICMFFIKGHCIHEDRCFKAHDKLPYRWESKQSGQWTSMADNEKIEKDYCNPENTYSTSSPPVHFDTMKCKTDEVRRLSTVNSVLEPDFIHTTDWLWYWEDEYGKWYQYAAITSEHRLASITSTELEEGYLKNDKDVMTFSAGSQSYELSFQDMIQTNPKYGTKRLVRRRPRFVSAAEAQTKRKHPKHPKRSNAVPDYWDKTQVPFVGFKTVALPSSSGEYKEIQDLFRRTMAGFEIVKIERVQNKAVWEAFQLCKTHMKIKNGGQPVLEKKLFHGTDPKHVDTICEANFDWRVCGVNGTVYGQGSYFARDAKYSHDYTGDSDPRFMFVSRVLVGEFAQGSSEYRRPPSKDGGDVNLFNSCVNDVTNPSIFVVFNAQQIYPEYLLQYRRTGQSNHYSQSAYAAARPTTYPLFRTTPQPTAPATRAPPFTPSPSTSYSTNTSTANDTQSSCIIA